MDKKSALQNLVASFNRNINKYNEFNQKAYDFGSGYCLYPSEIHILNAIAKDEGLNISELGKKIGITKSAVSQVAIKLEKKGMIKKYYSPENNKSILISLTKIGMEVVENFHRSQEEIFFMFIDAFKKTDKEKIIFIQQVFDSIEQNLDYKLNKYK
jgi:DNA-binding MarR family transcriptional regulator